MIILKCSSKNYNFGKLVSDTMNLTASQHLKTFLMKSVVILANVFVILQNDMSTFGKSVKLSRPTLFI